MPNDLNDGADTQDADAQDRAEVFDETNITRDGEDIAHPDVARDVFDVTTEPEDSEPFELVGEDFDPDLADEAERETLLDQDDGVDDETGVPFDDEADLVSGEDTGAADFEAGENEGGDETAPTHDPAVEKRLDEGIEETFPASDPVSINPGAD